MFVIVLLVVVVVVVLAMHVVMYVGAMVQLPSCEEKHIFSISSQTGHLTLSFLPSYSYFSLQDVDDLKARLALPLRRTPSLEGANFSYGFSDATLEAVVKHWRTTYDWKKREARLNSYPHFKYELPH